MKEDVPVVPFFRLRCRCTIFTKPFLVFLFVFVFFFVNYGIVWWWQINHNKIWHINIGNKIKRWAWNIENMRWRKWIIFSVDWVLLSQHILFPSFLPCASSNWSANELIYHLLHLGLGVVGSSLTSCTSNRVLCERKRIWALRWQNWICLTLEQQSLSLKLTKSLLYCWNWMFTILIRHVAEGHKAPDERTDKARPNGRKDFLSHFITERRNERTNEWTNHTKRTNHIERI